MRSVVLCILLLTLCSVTAQTKIYKIVNKDGTISFSDTPAPGAEEVILNKTENTMQSILTPSPALPSQQPQGPQYSLSILSPEPDATVRNNSGKINIASQIVPEVRGVYSLDFGGERYTSNSGVFNLEGINRGSYSYTVSFTDNSGKVIASSEPRMLHMHQASVLIRNAVN
ncbi:DUF4124 domain-containing protein [Glaciecola sp. XM2]|jgi:hypothetical protein|uniref:DUF4124 domain-containing protein n=1 Tax=Glaciecola sp. XM2 TaxID=1914931 RepID=UPI001BDF4EFF|nr:DUF4124 domain-containing protein [Glaciecola sp. XM2]MBT1450188.1 DUF4124 domain-containing protein [Glaciecola sp. XM2]